MSFESRWRGKLKQQTYNYIYASPCLGSHTCKAGKRCPGPEQMGLQHGAWNWRRQHKIYINRISSDIRAKVFFVSVTLSECQWKEEGEPTSNKGQGLGVWWTRDQAKDQKHEYKLSLVCKRGKFEGWLKFRNVTQMAVLSPVSERNCPRTFTCCSLCLHRKVHLPRLCTLPTTPLPSASGSQPSCLYSQCPLMGCLLPPCSKQRKQVSATPHEVSHELQSRGKLSACSSAWVLTIQKE